VALERLKQYVIDSLDRLYFSWCTSGMDLNIGVTHLEETRARRRRRSRELNVVFFFTKKNRISADSRVMRARNGKSALSAVSVDLIAPHQIRVDYFDVVEVSRFVPRSIRHHAGAFGRQTGRSPTLLPVSVFIFP
jgi:hypothetical protein